MKISLIAAVAKNRIIGKDNQMPWHLPADFAWFRQHTLGKSILMGRKTYESIGRPLPHRRNIVLTRDTNWRAEGVEVVHDLETVWSELSKREEVMVIGGGSIYAACLPFAERIYLTMIDAEIEGDTQFPELGNDWTCIVRDRYLADEKNAYDMEFLILEK